MREFKIGDKVLAWGIPAEVIGHSQDGSSIYAALNGNRFAHRFEHDGKELPWHKVPSLKHVDDIPKMPIWTGTEFEKGCERIERKFMEAPKKTVKMAPWKAPEWTCGEFYHDYMLRLIESLENHVNKLLEQVEVEI